MVPWPSSLVGFPFCFSAVVLCSGVLVFRFLLGRLWFSGFLAFRFCVAFWFCGFLGFLVFLVSGLYGPFSFTRLYSFNQNICIYLRILFCAKKKEFQPSVPVS